MPGTILSPRDGAWQAPLLSPINLHAENLAKESGVSRVLAQLLLNRQINNPEAVKEFLASDPTLNWPRPDFEPALVALFRPLLAQQALIVVHGDYDADGLTGTTILTEFLRSSGFRVEPFLPTRSLGYGLNMASLERFAAAGAQLLITVDCGVSNRTEIAHAQSLGMQVIITDHHGLGDTLPNADFILHPEVLKIPELKHLSGVGMAYWLAVLLHPHFDCQRPLSDWLELAGIGTIADMTPLLGFNRQLVKAALKQIKQTRRPGLLALLKQKQTEAAELDETALAFRVIPLLNAAGRLQSPMLSLDLLLAEDRDEAESLAENLNQVNQARREMGQSLFDEITAKLDADPPSGPVILAEAGWPFGILGITCSQLVERYGRPVFLMSVDGALAKASVRAPEGFHVLEALQHCDELFLKYGGHAQAGGFSISVSNFAALKQRLEDYYRFLGAPQSRPKAELELNLKAVDMDLWKDLQHLAPFGAGNPLPSFVSFNVPLQKVMPDRKGLHLFAEFSSGLKLKGWNMWRPELAEFSHFDLHYELQINTWKGRSNLELQLKQIQPHVEPVLPLAPSQSLSQSPLLPLQMVSVDVSDAQADLHFFQPHTDRFFQLAPASAPFDPDAISWLDGRQRHFRETDRDPHTWILRPPAEFLGQDCSRWAGEEMYCRHLIVEWVPENREHFLFALRCTLPEKLTFLPTDANWAAPPSFTELREAQAVLTKFPEQAPEACLSAALSLSRSRARLLLTILADLNLPLSISFASASERSTQRYDLRDSPAFLAYLSRYKLLIKQAQIWQNRSIKALRQWLG
ncbi:MAG: DHH family phosphoesterase [Candidatus Sericytochromatia bacterium]